jgi:hypothetical protein
LVLSGRFNQTPPLKRVSRDGTDCLIQNYPDFQYFIYKNYIRVNLKKLSIKSPDSLLLEVGRSGKTACSALTTHDDFI